MELAVIQSIHSIDQIRRVETSPTENDTHSYSAGPDEEKSVAEADHVNHQSKPLDVVASDSELRDSEHAVRKDGGWRAWSSVVAGFLQLTICLGGPNAFGVYQAESVTFATV